MLAPAFAAEEVLVRAHALSARSQNVSPRYAAFDDLTLCVGRGGFMEWTVNVRSDRAYYIHFFACSGERRTYFFLFLRFFAMGRVGG